MGLPLCHVVRELCGVSTARDTRVEKPKVSSSLCICEFEINPFINRQCHNSLSIYLDNNRVVDIQIYEILAKRSLGSAAITNDVLYF
jgi:hypothetical protein